MLRRETTPYRTDPVGRSLHPGYSNEINDDII